MSESDLVSRGGDEASRGMLEVWAGSLAHASGEIATRAALTVVETQSGLTAAIVRKYDLKIGRGNLARTAGNTLIVMSLLSDSSNAMIFEAHQSQTNHRRIGRPTRFDACDAFCTRLVIAEGVVSAFPGTTSLRLDGPETPNDVVRSYMNRMANPLPGQDVFDPASVAARIGVQEVLSVHTLLSPAAREAFGLEAFRALPPA